MKEQTARVINTHQTFNCTISEQRVRMCVREHCQLERSGDDIRVGTFLSTWLTRSRSH